VGLALNRINAKSLLAQHALMMMMTMNTSSACARVVLSLGVC
jgi:hypothetical protein